MFQLNHHKQDSHVTRSKIFYSFIQPLLLFCAPAFGYEFYSWQSTHTPHSQHLQSDPHLQSSWKSVVEPFCGNSQHIKIVGCFRRGTLLLMFNGILSATLSKEKISTTGVTQGNLELLLPPFFPVSHQTNTIRFNLGRTPHSHFHHPLGS